MGVPVNAVILTDRLLLAMVRSPAPDRPFQSSADFACSADQFESGTSYAGNAYGNMRSLPSHVTCDFYTSFNSERQETRKEIAMERKFFDVGHRVERPSGSDPTDITHAATGNAEVGMTVGAELAKGRELFKALSREAAGAG